MIFFLGTGCSHNGQNRKHLFDASKSGDTKVRCVQWRRFPTEQTVFQSRKCPTISHPGVELAGKEANVIFLQNWSRSVRPRRTCRTNSVERSRCYSDLENVIGFSCWIRLISTGNLIFAATRIRHDVCKSQLSGVRHSEHFKTYRFASSKSISRRQND